MRRAEVIAAISAHREDIARRFGVRSLSLFGSVARDEAGPDSDVDLVVEFEGPTTFDGHMGLLVFLEDLHDQLHADAGALDYRLADEHVRVSHNPAAPIHPDPSLLRNGAARSRILESKKRDLGGGRQVSEHWNHRTKSAEQFLDELARSMDFR